MIKIYLEDVDREFVRAANSQLSEYVESHFHPYDSLEDKQSILKSDDVFEEFVFDGLFPKHLYRLDKKKCIDTALELREWIKDSSEHELDPLKEYILHKILIILDQYDRDCDFILTNGSEEERESEEDEENYTLKDLKNFHFYLEHCFQDYDFDNAEDYFTYAIHDPNFEESTSTYLTEYKELVPWDIVKKYEEVKELRFMFKNLMKDKVNLLKQNGEVYENLKANVEKDKILISGISIIIEEGDTIIRALSNNHTEEYIVMDSSCFERKYGIPEHYKLEVRKLTSLSDSNTPGSITIFDRSINTINGGSNNRFNKNSTDYSTNLIYTKTDITVFDEIREKLNEAQLDQIKKVELLSQVDDLEEAVDTPNFIGRYQKFISSAADHMTLIGPLIPALTELIK
ncbi:hypothetical protein [Priestia megaterium]|uniref:hypothetical protein n=1 Tax=Priestia megaterium TaxID=1404 RepID=UPI0036D9B125